MIEIHVIENLISPSGLPLTTGGLVPDEGRRSTTPARKSRVPSAQMSVPTNQWDFDDLDSAIDLLNICGQRRMDSLALLKQNYDDCSLTDDETDSDSICDRVVVGLFQSPDNRADFQSSCGELSDTTNTDLSDTLSPPFLFPAFRKRTSNMAQQSNSLGLSADPPYSDVLNIADAGAKKDDFYVVVAEHSDEEERDSGRMGSGKGGGLSQLDSSADKGDDDFVVVYAEDGGGEDGEASADKHCRAVLPANMNGIGSTAVSSHTLDSTVVDAESGAVFRNGNVPTPMVTDTGNFQSLVTIFDGLDNPALPVSNVAVSLDPVSEPISSMASFTSQPVLDSRATPLFPTSQPLPSAGCMSPLGAGTSTVSDVDTATGNDPTDGPFISITSQSTPGAFEEGEPVNTNSSTFLSQVRFFAGRTWSVRGEKVKEAKRQKNIPVGLMNIDQSQSEKKPGRGSGMGSRGRGRGSRARGGRGRGGSTETTMPKSPSAETVDKTFFNPKSPSSPFRVSVASLTKHGETGAVRRRVGRPRGRGAGRLRKSASPVPSDHSSETYNRADSPVFSSKSSSRGSNTGRSHGHGRGGVVSRGGKHSPDRGSDTSPVQGSHSPASSRGRHSRGSYSPARESLSPASTVSRSWGSRGRGKYSLASRGSVGDDTYSTASKITSGGVAYKQKSKAALRGLGHILPPFSPLRTRSADIDAKPNRPDYREMSPSFSPVHTRSGSALGSDSGFGSSPNPNKPSLKNKTASMASAKKKESAKNSLSPVGQNRESSVASISGDSARDISPVVKLVKLTGMEAGQMSSPGYKATKRQHDSDNPPSSPGPSKRSRPDPESSKKMTEAERQESLTKSVGEVMSYLFGENLVGQCPAGFVVNVKLEVEKKKEEGEASGLPTCAAASTGEQCCQHNSSNPDDCPCLQKLSNSQLAAFLHAQVSKRRDMQAKTRAKILASITHLIQELDN